jgi:glycosyltransferase involved in cell wall biosynthesis
MTPPVVAEFPGVRLVEETIPGLSYARNAGINASIGEIIVATDDDVTMPSTWLEALVQPFARADVMVVTGNTLPLELDTRAQQLFEQYGGLGRGYSRLEADHSWFNFYRRRAAPTWELGATANAAFRASIFADPRIGMVDETLGAGSPTGCSEDTYVFYKVLRAGYTLVYEPDAYVWHRHRRDMPALKSQIYNYSKGHVAYHLTTAINDGDMRGLYDIFVRLPRWRVKQLKSQVKRAVTGRERYPFSLIVAETTGNMAGPYALWKSRQRVKKLGRSVPSVPPTQQESEPVADADHDQIAAN